MRLTRRIATTVLLLGVILTLDTDVRAQTLVCKVPVDYVDDASPLPVVRRHLRDGGDLRFLAIGSASMAGMGASSPARSYAQRFLVVFQERFQRPTSLDNKAARSMAVNDWLPRLERDVVSAHPALVLWEAGTVDAVRGADPVEFTRHLAEGVQQMKKAGIDVILVNPLYSKRTASMLQLRPYIEAMKAVAAAENLVLFDRFEIMRFWAESGFFKFGDKPDAAMMAENDQIFDCLGRLLVSAVDRSLKSGP